VSATGLPDHRRLVARGITWNTAYQFFEIGLTFGAMLILVRIIPPVEYGRFGAVLGFLALLNSFGFAGFVAHALQLPDGEEPDWSLHWSAGMYIQGFLTLACNVLAGACWFLPAYRPIAPLLHLASAGIFLDWPARLCTVMLRRELDFRRSKVLLGCSMAVQLGTTIIGGYLGGGAYAIVLGANVVPSLPLAVDLLFVRRWRPRQGWWRWPDWAAYRPALHFGYRQTGASLLWSARGALEVAVLARTVGYVPIGLWNRAQALSRSTLGRIGNVLVETGYPFLPRYAADRAQYARQATLFLQVFALAIMPGVLYVGLQGRALSRLLYGDRWVAADPLIWPAALSAFGLAMFGIGSAVVLASGRVHASFMLNVLAAGLSMPMVAVAWVSYDLVAYAWVLAASQIAAAVVALASASSQLAHGWVRSALVPPATASLAAMSAVLLGEHLVGSSASPVAALCSDTAIYGMSVMLVLRGLFPRALASVLSRAPFGDRLSGWLRLPPAPAAAAVP
jgi:O-antigen/teichoic acid export membrane protein